MAKWNNATWNSGALWGPAVPPTPPIANQKPKKTSNMTRQPFFPRTIGLRSEWFHNFAIELPLANPILQLPAAAVTAIVADARFCEYASGPYLTAGRDFGPSLTKSLEILYSGFAVDPYVLPVFTPPPLPAGVTAVAPGALTRILAFCKTIKASPYYTEAIGLQLGIVGSEDTAEHPVPTFNAVVERGPTCECVRLNFQKHGRMGVVVYCRRNNGEWEELAVDNFTPYIDARPLLDPTKAELREYRLRYFDGHGPVGEFSDIVSVSVAP